LRLSKNIRKIKKSINDLILKIIHNSKLRNDDSIEGIAKVFEKDSVLLPIFSKEENQEFKVFIQSLLQKFITLEVTYKHPEIIRIPRADIRINRRIE
jgi:hypothetical protein